MEEKLVTLATHSLSRAQMLQGRLESEGIDCYLKNVNLVQGAPGGVKVRIRQGDVDRALRVVMEINKSYELEKITPIVDKIQGSKILVPVDFTEHSENAAKFALTLAHKLNAEVFLFHSYFSFASDIITVTDTHATQTNLEIVIKEIEQRAKRNIEILYSNLEDELVNNKIDNVTLHYSLTLVQPEDEVFNVINNYNPDIIVIGEGKNKTDEYSHLTWSFVENINIPVVIIPEAAEYTGFDNVNYTRKLIYATNFDKSDYLAFRKLLAITRNFDLNLHLLHICKDKELEQSDRVKLDHFIEYFMEINKNVSVDASLIYDEDVNSSIIKFVNEQDVDFMAITTHKRDIVERFISPSITKNIISQLKIPIFIFHSK